MFNGGVEMVSLYMRCSTEELKCYRYTLDVQRMSRDAIVVHEMFNGGVEMLSSRDAIVIHETFNEGVEMLLLYMRCSTDESRCYRYTLDVQRRSRDAIVAHEMFNERVEMLSLYMRCSKNESRCSSESVSSSQSTDKAPLWDYVTRVSKAVEKGGHRMGAVVACALPWLRSLPLQHASIIMSEEASLIALNSLYQESFKRLTFHKNRCCCIPDLLIVNCRAALDIVWMLISPSTLDIVWILNFVVALDTVWVLNFPEPWKYELKLKP
ncbi:hypothetical protein Tco_0404424 [Tanacetum coccineum]